MKKLTIFLSVILCLTCASFAFSSQQKLTKVRLNEVTHSVFYAPQYVAINNGYFKEQGIDIELTNGQGADKVMTAVISGQSDIGLAGPEACIYVHNEGKEDSPQVFAQLTKRDGSFLVGRKAVKNFKWSSLKGSTIIGGRKGGVPEMTLEYVLNKNKLVPGKDITVDTSVQFALMGGAFTGGKGDYVTLFEPVASSLEREKKGYILTSIGKESGEIPYTAYFAKQSYMKNNKKLMQKFTNALYKGQKWVDTHTPKQIAKAIKSSFPDTDLALLETVAKRYKDIDAWNKTPLLKSSSLDLLQKVMKQAGQLKETVPYSKIVTTTFADKAIKDVK